MCFYWSSLGYLFKKPLKLKKIIQHSQISETKSMVFFREILLQVSMIFIADIFVSVVDE